jgi:hypothetical protein
MSIICGKMNLKVLKESKRRRGVRESERMSARLGARKEDGEEGAERVKKSVE